MGDYPNWVPRWTRLDGESENMRNDDVIWEIPDQTIKKHEILEGYLSAWFPILRTASDHLLYIDGFSGPNEYVDGRPGSPQIALNAATKNPAADIPSRAMPRLRTPAQNGSVARKSALIHRVGPIAARARMGPQRRRVQRGPADSVPYAQPTIN